MVLGFARRVIISLTRKTLAFSRQRQVLAAARGTTTPGGVLGRGVEQTSVIRSVDSFVEKALIEENATNGSLQARTEAMQEIESLFNEQQRDGLAQELAAFYSAFDDVASSPTPGQTVEREALRTKAQTVIDTIHRLDAQLRDQQRTIDRAMSTRVGEINEMAERIADLNFQISRQEAIAPANDFRDERDRLVREMAEKVEIRTFEQNDGSINVLVGGGSPVVIGQTAYELEAQADGDHPFNPTFSKIVHTDGISESDITSFIAGGELGGYLDARDDIIGGAIRTLDEIAFNLSYTVNQQHMAGVGLDNAQHNFFAEQTQVEDAAQSILLHDDILANVDAIAAGTTDAAGDTRNAKLLGALSETEQSLAQIGDTIGSFSGPNRSVLDHTVTVIADIGEQTRSLNSAVLQQEQVMRELQDRRDATSAVSIDEEVVNLIRLQSAYQANARVVSIVQSMLNDLAEMV